MAAHREGDKYYVLVTGANSGLGYGICCRLIDEFLQTRPQSQSLVLIITTRDQSKSDDTVSRLRKYLQKALRHAGASKPGIDKLLEPRIQFEQEIVELTSLRSVQNLAYRLNLTLPKLNAIVLNAGIAGIIGIDWLKAVWLMLTKPMYALTASPFRITATGWTTKPQLNGSSEKEPQLGQIFTANVFGHYMLVHYLMPLLSQEPGCRIIWLGSFQAQAETYNPRDIQAVDSHESYESSKRIIDILALTYALPSTAPWVASFLRLPQSASGGPHRPQFYTTSPGAVATNVFPLPWILQLCMMAAFYLARFLGSTCHNVRPYVAACAPVWLALEKQEMLDAMEEKEGKGKWASATDRWGNERVERLDVEGWGFGGKVGDHMLPEGRRKASQVKGSKALTKEDREQFEQLGRGVWQEMERLRMEWEARLGANPLQPTSDIEEIDE